MQMKIKALALAAMLVFAPRQAHAAEILDQSSLPATGSFTVTQTQEMGVGSGQETNVIGQSFTPGMSGLLSRIDLVLTNALTTPVSATLRLFGPSPNNNNPMQFWWANAPLASRTVSLPSYIIPFNGTFNRALIPSIDISAIGFQVTAGQQIFMTLTFTGQNSVVWPMALNGQVFSYAGGTALSGRSDGTPIGQLSSFDLGFRTYVTQVSAVPEPATWSMLIAGFGLVGWTMRRRRAGYAVRMG